MEQIHEKLRAYFKEIGISQAEISRQLGISKAAVNQYFIGTTKFGKKKAEKWAQTFGISESFLLTGKGSITSAESMQEMYEEQIRTLTETIHILTEAIKSKDEIIARLREKIKQYEQNTSNNQ